MCVTKRVVHNNRRICRKRVFRLIKQQIAVEQYPQPVYPMVNQLNRYLFSARNFCEFRACRILCIGLLGMLMTAAAPSLSAADTKSYQEFVRALNIIHQTQLSIFADTVPTSRDEVVAEYNALLEKAEAELDTSSSNYTVSIEEKRIEIMRQLLSSTLEQYNDKTYGRRKY